jgi:hypothetical protein
LLCLPLGNPLGRAQDPLQGPQQTLRARPEHLRLAFLVGQWEEEIAYAGRENAAEKSRGRWVAQPQLGHYLVIRYQGRGPEGNYRAMGVLTWDHETQACRMWWFDDAGGVGEYRGSFPDDNDLVLEHRGKVEGRDFRERITYTRVSPGEVRTKIEQAYVDEPYKTYLEAVAHRAQATGPDAGGPVGPPP